MIGFMIDSINANNELMMIDTCFSMMVRLFFGRLPTLTQILLSGVDNHQLETNEGKFT